MKVWWLIKLPKHFDNILYLSRLKCLPESVARIQPNLQGTRRPMGSYFWGQAIRPKKMQDLKNHFFFQKKSVKNDFYETKHLTTIFTYFFIPTNEIFH